MMERVIEPELLDGLPSEDPRAARSRRDLRRINAWMGNARLTAALLGERARRAPPRRIVDLGAGDGSLLLRWLRRLPALPRGIEVILVDQLGAADPGVLAQLRGRGFVPRVERADALDWLRACPVDATAWVTANLFLHHLSAGALGDLFGLVAGKAGVCCACEPRRGWWPLAASRLLWLIGANAVTRHDAVVSVRAGFEGRELSALWPARAGWRLREEGAGFFSHVFLAERA